MTAGTDDARRASAARMSSSDHALSPMTTCIARSCRPLVPSSAARYASALRPRGRSTQSRPTARDMSSANMRAVIVSAANRRALRSISLRSASGVVPGSRMSRISLLCPLRQCFVSARSARTTEFTARVARSGRPRMASSGISG